MKKLFAAVIAISACAALAIIFGVDATVIKKKIFQQAMPLGYFEPYSSLPAKFENVSGPIYSFRYGFNRGLVVDTDEGLAVFDTFNREYAAALIEQLRESFPGKQVKWVFYSHHHLDHVRGAAILGPQVVVGHSDVNPSLDDWPHAKDILRVTAPFDGDSDLVLGAVQLKMLYMPPIPFDIALWVLLPDGEFGFCPRLDVC